MQTTGQTIRGRHFETLLPVEVSIDGRNISAITPCECSPAESDALPFISPGFFDIQINGYAGIWFCSPDLTVDDVETVTRALLARGITSYFPTLITASHEALHHGFTVLKQACEEREIVGDCVAGYHLEGPFISAEDGPRGAHPLQHVRPASYEEFQRLQKASGNRIRLVTLAAESENAESFIQKCTDDGVVVALGHTGATPQQIHSAVSAGARLSTHFGNGAHGTLPRHPNYLWEQLAEDRLWASVIADGWHVPESVLKCVLKCKTLEQTILTCDVSGFAGCPPGIYHEGDVAVEVLENGPIVVAGQRQFLAGSAATTGDCVAHMALVSDVSLANAVNMATVNPARLFDQKLPTLEVGQNATFTVFSVNSETLTQSPRSRFIPKITFVDGQRFAPPVV